MKESQFRQHNSRWTQREDDLCVAEVKKNLEKSTKEIAETFAPLLQRSGKAVYERLLRLLEIHSDQAWAKKRQTIRKATKWSKSTNWRTEELEIIEQWLKENPNVIYKRGARELADILEPRTVSAIESRLQKAAKDCGHRQTKHSLTPMPESEVESPAPEAIVTPAPKTVFKKGTPLKPVTPMPDDSPIPLSFLIGEIQKRLSNLLHGLDDLMEEGNKLENELEKLVSEAELIEEWMITALNLRKRYAKIRVGPDGFVL